MSSRTGGSPPGAMPYAEVSLDRPISHTLTYSIPDALATTIRVGSIVEVPLRTQLARGVVVGVRDKKGFKGPIKPIERALTPDYALGPGLIELARWVAEYYWCSLGEALSAAAFFGLNDVHAKTKSFLALDHAEHWAKSDREVGPDGKKVTPKQALVIHSLLAVGNEPMTPAELASDASVGDGVLRTMLSRGYLTRVDEAVERGDDYPEPSGAGADPHELTPHQESAVEAIAKPLGAGEFKAFLLHGVTGSGKTEVYLRIIASALRMGRSAICLVPEIALTPQTVDAFRSRLGSVVAVYHSRLTVGQKYDLWRKIDGGEVRVLIGARSAVFAPFENLGVVVVDEEHEATYKQGETPRYHARDLAVWRAAKAGAVTILGTATPSLESHYNARQGKYQLLRLPERIGPHAPVIMKVVDMRRHIREGDVDSAAALLSPALREAVEKRLEAGEQTVLLLNRRGFASRALCLACEKVIQCPHCDVALTYHKVAGRLICHWCNHRERLPDRCPDPKCGASEIHTLGHGTQKIEERVAECFPTARVLRVDVDAMRGRRAYIDAWRSITSGDVDIILGTQMIAKGFHLESVTLVGVISVDFALGLPDFRSAERTYHLLTQVAGRSGRGDRPGEVIVQSYIPHHYAIDLAARLEEEQFYKRELHIREMLSFPPHSRLAAVLASGPDEAIVREQAGRLANMLKSLARRPGYHQLRVLGPAPAPIARLEDQHRWRVLMRAPTAGPLHEILGQGLAAFDRVHEKSKVHLTIDIDPVDLL